MPNIPVMAPCGNKVSTLMWCTKDKQGNVVGLEEAKQQNGAGRNAANGAARHPETAAQREKRQQAEKKKALLKGANAALKGSTYYQKELAKRQGRNQGGGNAAVAPVRDKAKDFVDKKFCSKCGLGHADEDAQQCRHRKCGHPFQDGKASPAPPRTGKAVRFSKDALPFEAALGVSLGERLHRNYSAIYMGEEEPENLDGEKEESTEMDEDGGAGPEVEKADPHPARSKAMRTKDNLETQLEGAKALGLPAKAIKVIQDELDALVVPSVAAHMKDVTKNLSDLHILTNRTKEEFLKAEEAEVKMLEAARKQVEAATKRLQDMQAKMEKDKVARERLIAAMEEDANALAKEVAEERVAGAQPTKEQVSAQKEESLGPGEGAAPGQPMAEEMDMEAIIKLLNRVAQEKPDFMKELVEGMAADGADGKRRKSAEKAADQEDANIA